ncbi:hypothetical protein EVAR_82894_1 [Eumeta japonica]|uniref:Uncharacterized protein n=1 Tax=Eumeta variegata TaxID=151549 RepID=A0A4C1YJR6_EUMVA|nr:hypothetical protein EVAR_82894_1 [Eumeta japonica]
MIRKCRGQPAPIAHTPGLISWARAAATGCESADLSGYADALSAPVEGAARLRSRSAPVILRKATNVPGSNILQLLYRQHQLKPHKKCIALMGSALIARRGARAHLDALKRINRKITGATKKRAHKTSTKTPRPARDSPR